MGGLAERGRDSARDESKTVGRKTLLQERKFCASVQIDMTIKESKHAENKETDLQVLGWQIYINRCARRIERQNAVCLAHFSRLVPLRKKQPINLPQPERKPRPHSNVRT
jgi:hypothetical protein